MKQTVLSGRLLFWTLTVLAIAASAAAIVILRRRYGWSKVAVTALGLAVIGGWKAASYLVQRLVHARRGR